MIKNYLLIALRNLKKNTLFSFINIAGLAIGLAASIMIWLWVYDELSFDKFHDNSDRIYRVERDMYIDDTRMLVPITSPPMAPQIASDYPVVESFTRLAYDDVMVEDNHQNLSSERIFYADSSFFSIFSFRVISGDPAECLKDPFSVALSQSIAEKYFGDNPQPGGVLDINYNGQVFPYTVTAIYEDFPHNSHIQAEMIGSFSSMENFKHEMMMTGWLSSFLYTYVLLSENVDPVLLEDQMQEMVETYFGPEIRDILHIDDPTEFLKIKLAPLTGIHLNSNRTWEIESPGSKASVAVFSLVALLLLVIAGINFTNLSSARASKRSLEVGIRKVSGANKNQLINQFIGESLLMSFIALLFAFLLIELTLPVFSVFTGKEMNTGMLFEGWNLPVVIFAWLTTAFLSGTYPAFILSSFKPVEVLKGKQGKRSSRFFGKVLVTAQFVISVGLIICSVTVYRHLQFINNKDLGYERTGLIDIPIENRTIFSSYDAFKQDLFNNPAIQDVTRSMIIPTDRNYTDNPHILRDNPQPFFPVINRVDNHYLPTLGIKILAGENFSENMVADTSSYYIINDEARKMFGFQSPFDALGRETGLLTGANGESRNWGQIVGVCENFHFQPLTEDIKPMVISASLGGHNHITIRVDEQDIGNANREIGEVWDNYFPGQLYSSSIVSQNFDSQHMTERRLQVILLIFTILAIFVACIGLLGLSSFSVEQRLKEIGIRKALGAQIHEIIILISSEFSRLILIAAVIAMPIAYFIMREWLNNFPYRREPELWVFLGATVIALITALFTVFIQTYKASMINPVETLKYE